MKVLLVIFLFPFLAHSQLSFDLSVVQPNCTGLGNISVINLTGTPPFTITGAGSHSAGIYTVSVTDVFGNVKSRQATLAPYSFDFTYSIIKASCNTGRATITANPAGSYTYEVNGVVRNSNIVTFPVKNMNVVRVKDSCGNVIQKTYAPFPGFAPYIQKLDYRLQCDKVDIFPMFYGFDNPTVCLYQYGTNVLVQCKRGNVGAAVNFFDIPYGIEYYVIVQDRCARDSMYFPNMESAGGSQIDPYNYDCNGFTMHVDAPAPPAQFYANNPKIYGSPDSICLFNAATNQLVLCKKEDTVSINPRTGVPWPSGAVWTSLPYGCYYAYIFDPCDDTTYKIDSCVQYPFSVRSASLSHCDYDKTSVTVNLDPGAKPPYTVSIYYPGGSLAGTTTSSNTTVSQAVNATVTGGILTVVAQDACGNKNTSYVLQETSRIERTIEVIQKCPGLTGTSGSGDILLKATNGVPKIISPSLINYTSASPHYLFPNLPSGTYILEYTGSHCNPIKIYDTVVIREYDYPRQQILLTQCGGGFMTFKDSVIAGVTPYSYQLITPYPVTQSHGSFVIGLDTISKVEFKVTDACGNSNAVSFLVNPISCQFLPARPVQRSAQIEEKSIYRVENDLLNRTSKRSGRGTIRYERSFQRNKNGTEEEIFSTVPLR